MYKHVPTMIDEIAVRVAGIRVVNLDVVRGFDAEASSENLLASWAIDVNVLGATSWHNDPIGDCLVT
jgi:hypothetical protein